MQEENDMMNEDGMKSPEKSEKPKMTDHSVETAGFASHLNIVASSHFNFNYVYGSVIWFSFFLPLTSRYYIENAFNLPYIGVNSLCLYAALAMFFLLSWPTFYFIWRWNNPNDPSQLFNNYKLGINISLVSAQLGATVKLFSFFNYKEDGIFILFAIGQIILVLGVVTYFIVSVLHLKYTMKQAFALNDTFSTIASGLVLSILVVQSVYNNTDKFFTKLEQVHIKNFAIECADWLLIFICLIYHMCMCNKIIKDQQEVQARNMSLRSAPAKNLVDTMTDLSRRKRVSVCARLMRAQPLAILLASFFFTYQKVIYFPLQFWFTQNEADIMIVFFAVGFLVGSLNGGLMAMLQVKDKYRIIQVTFLSFFFLGIIIIEATAQLGYIWLLGLGAFIISLSLAILTSIELMLLDIPVNAQTAATPDPRDWFPVVPLAFTFFGLYGVALTAVGDKTHYMNRDDNTWAYVSIAISSVLVISACFLTLKWFKNGCTCCVNCCCRCCKPCCMGEEEQEEV